MLAIFIFAIHDLHATLSVYFFVEILGVGVGGVDSDGYERHYLLAWLISPATINTKLQPPFTARTPDLLASSVAC